MRVLVTGSAISQRERLHNRYENMPRRPFAPKLIAALCGPRYLLLDQVLMRGSARASA
jgi:hypothetical protein